MWFLKSLVDAGIQFSLPSGKDVIVGRKEHECDVLIQKDQSISRKHAVIRVEEGPPEDNKPRVYLTDCKSKFGTYVNGRKLSANEKVALHRNDVIKFGQGPTSSRFKVVYEPLVFCCSGMNGTEKANIKQLAKSLGARVASNWTLECTHLVMSCVTVTVKVVSALASCRPIVTPAWLEEAVKCLRNKQAFPNCASFLPEVVDSNIGGGSEDVSFGPNFRRTTLLQDRVFYFLTKKQHDRLSLCVKEAGATCKLAPSSDSISLESLTAKESIVVSVDSELVSQMTPAERNWVAQVNEFLQSRGLRPVLDSEIGFALLHISTDNYCNPRSSADSPPLSMPLPAPSLSQQIPFDFPTHTSASTLPFTQDTYSQPNITVLAPETEMSVQSQTVKREKNEGTMKINETIFHTKKSPAIATAKDEPLEYLFDLDQSFPPAEVRSKLNLRRKLDLRRKIPPGPATSTQHEEGDAMFAHSAAHPPKTKPCSLIVEDSQPESEEPSRTVLPGLRKPQNISFAANRSEILAPQSMESNFSSLDPNASLLAANSLTPRSQDGAKAGKKSLPDSDVISKLFRGKRKKRGVEETEEASQTQNKRPCLEAEQQDGREGPTASGASLFSGLQGTGSRVKRPTAKPTTGVASDTSTSAAMEDGSLTAAAVVVSHTSEPRLLATREDTTKENTPKTPERAGGESSLHPTTPTEPKTPGRRSQHSSTPFLSTRRRKKSTPKVENTTTAATSTPASRSVRHTEATEHENDTGASLKTGASQLTSPFTCLTAPLATGGKRTKATGSTDTHADDLWTLDNDMNGPGGMDTESPLECYGTGPRRIYKPVLTEDGFICSRSKPKLQAPSRLARLGMLAFSGSQSSSSGTETGGEELSLPTAPVDITVVSLVVRREREKEGEEGGRKRKEEGENGRVKNFKKFRKVQNAGSGSIPSIVSLVEYVPETSKDLQDWLMEKENEQDTRPVEESSQDLFRFTIPSKRKRTTH